MDFDAGRRSPLRQQWIRNPVTRQDDEEERPGLSVIVPCYNEERRLGDTLPTILDAMRARAQSFEVVIVDDGSSDRTVEVAESIDAEEVVVIRQERNRGKGAAVRRGVLDSRGGMVLMTDADLSTPLHEVEALVAAIADGADVAIGSRAVDRARIKERQPWLRDRLGRMFNLVIRILGVRGIKDTQCGFKLFTRSAADAVFPNVVIERWTLAVEALLIARKLSLRIDEIPVDWANSPNSRVDVLRDALGTMRDLIRIRLRWAFRKPGPG